MDVAKDLCAGGLANLVSSCVLNPCDVVKVRLQAQSALELPAGTAALYTSPSQTVRKIVAEEGLFAAWGGLWTPGIVASALREVSYSSLRFGLYAPTKKLFATDGDGDAGLLVKIASGATSGGLGSVIATPTDVVKIRFQKEAGRLDPATGTYATGLHEGRRPTYRSTAAAFATIYREGGMRGLYVGWQPTMLRAAFLAGTQLSTYDHTKYTLKRLGLMREGTPLHLGASVVAAAMTTMVTQPVDTVKTLLMSATKPTGEPLYSSPLRCAAAIARTHGPLGFLRGATPSFARFAPHFCMTFPLYEQARKIVGLPPV